MKSGLSQGDTTSRLPVASRVGEAARVAGQLSVSDPAAAALIAATAGNSPFLARLITRRPELFTAFVTSGAEKTYRSIPSIPPEPLDQKALMCWLRERKEQVALVTALADISGQWSLEQVTGALSDLAEQSVRICLRHLLSEAVRRGELTAADPTQPEKDSGIIILGMGKLGAHELNYSSDIDLMVLFDKDGLPYTGARNSQIFMNKLASDLVTLLQERTSDGYVFRVDLRLRPDPMSTPLAVTVAAALAYYETVGQNWERAAMIKARAIAGDAKAGESFLRELIPYVWRKSLDFATIADIHSIKRQMNVGAGQIELAGHNIKTGIGGIREIEFYAATQQLVWGGRIPELRVRGTLQALDALYEYELVTSEIRDRLHGSYRFLRTLEHRLQMVEDAQTHDVPESREARASIATFMGFDSLKSFEQTCLATLGNVHGLYTDSMAGSEPLAVDGNLVFTGVEADPGTLKTLSRMGYTETQRISDIIQGWHRGSRRSTRSKRSRQVLTELVPVLLTALGKTANPDSAFFHFDDFIGRLPSGAQIFSLFNSRHELLALLADILGSAPALGDTLSNDPSLLDGVLESDFFTTLPEKQELEDLLTERLRYAHAYEQKMGYLRIFNNEKRFQAGVHLLKGIATPKQVGAFLSDLAEVILQASMQEVWREYEQAAEALPTVPFAVLGLGKLGGREMTFGSDLDIVFLYNDANAPLEQRTHVNRLSQRLISALTLLTREGRLFEIDTRLRPGGADGPLATSLTAFDLYFDKTAWTYEFMALTRGRVVATNAPDFADRVSDAVRKHVLKKRDPETLLNDVLEMRARIAKEFSTANPWAIKHVRGGMVDLEFIAQYLVLKHGAKHPEIWHHGVRKVIESAAQLGVLPKKTAAELIEARKFLSDLLSLLRLSAPGGVITDDAPAGLKRLLIDALRVGDFDTIKQHVLMLEDIVKHAFDQMQTRQF